MHTLDLHRLVVVLVDKGVFQMECIGKTAGHARAEVAAHRLQNRGQTAGRIFAAVVADTLRHRMATGVANRKAFSGPPQGKELPPVAPQLQALPMMLASRPAKTKRCGNRGQTWNPARKVAESVFCHGPDASEKGPEQTISLHPGSGSGETAFCRRTLHDAWRDK